MMSSTDQPKRFHHLRLSSLVHDVFHVEIHIVIQITLKFDEWIFRHLLAPAYTELRCANRIALPLRHKIALLCLCAATFVAPDLFGQSHNEAKKGRFALHIFYKICFSRRDKAFPLKFHLGQN
jgi:hypothetical protein